MSQQAHFSPKTQEATEEPHDAIQVASDSKNPFELLASAWLLLESSMPLGLRHQGVHRAGKSIRYRISLIPPASLTFLKERMAMGIQSGISLELGYQVGKIIQSEGKMSLKVSSVCAWVNIKDTMASVWLSFLLHKTIVAFLLPSLWGARGDVITLEKCSPVRQIVKWSYK